MEQQTILIVEDEEIWNRLLCRVFTEAGYKVVSTQSCAEATRAFRTNRPDCVVLDYNLPDGSPGSLCAEIKACRERTMPVVVFSSDPEAEGFAEEYGADVFVPKYTGGEKILVVVQKLIEEARVMPLGKKTPAFHRGEIKAKVLICRGAGVKDAARWRPFVS